jgi:hypothetical protein
MSVTNESYELSCSQVVEPSMLTEAASDRHCAVKRLPVTPVDIVHNKACDRLTEAASDCHAARNEAIATRWNISAYWINQAIAKLEAARLEIEERRKRSAP